jgi:hypothetical protein
VVLMKYGHALRRFTDHKPALSGIKRLAAEHPAVVKGGTLYRARIVDPANAVRLLKSGAHNRKIGGRVVKGAWAGMPVYTLTLEERATCPRSCQHWDNCFGNKMNWSSRLTAGPALEAGLEVELTALAERHPKGFVVRLHVLGDFYSVEYVQLWLGWLIRFPNLRVYGYTAWPASSPIGALIGNVARRAWSRFAIRHSNGSGSERATVTLYESPEGPTVGDAIVCPAQTGKSECCGTCGLCWGTERNIAFLAH